MNFFRSGQILFNLTHTFAARHEKKLCYCVFFFFFFFKVSIDLIALSLEK